MLFLLHLLWPREDVVNISQTRKTDMGKCFLLLKENGKLSETIGYTMTSSGSSKLYFLIVH